VAVAKYSATLARRDDIAADADPTELQDAVDEEQREIPDDHETTFLRVDGMHCATCEYVYRSTCRRE